jgi:hypothetical protein
MVTESFVNNMGLLQYEKSLLYRNGKINALQRWDETIIPSLTDK